MQQLTLLRWPARLPRLLRYLQQNGWLFVKAVNIMDVTFLRLHWRLNRLQLLLYVNVSDFTTGRNGVVLAVANQGSRS
jgi:hypothetical protein